MNKTNLDLFHHKINIFYFIMNVMAGRGYCAQVIMTKQATVNDKLIKFSKYPLNIWVLKFF